MLFMIASSQMVKLTDDILELSRVARSEMKFDEINLSIICTDICKTMSASDPTRNINWLIQPDLTIYSDKQLLY